ncbi:MAG: SDR family NAD(P)-dependent oxidoreductase [Spirochaetales bacterium]
MKPTKRGRASATVRLEGLRILVVGGIGTLGSTFARVALSRGAQVLIADRYASPENERVQAVQAHLEAAAERPDDLAAPISLDVTDIEQCVTVLESCADESPLDVVVNFAGLHHPPMDLLLDGPTHLLEAFQRVVDINLTGAFALTVASARVMAPHRHGHLIHLCSNGSRASLYGSYGYNASKHGVEALVKTAAAQLAPLGVRVNGVAPGTVITDLNRGLNFDEAGNPRPRARSILARTPTKRFATAEGVASTVLAMCVDQPHFTGNVVFCDDGYNIEGHSWPEGNMALYEGSSALERLYSSLDDVYPRAEATQKEDS